MRIYYENHVGDDEQMIMEYNSISLQKRVEKLWKHLHENYLTKWRCKRRVSISF